MKKLVGLLFGAAVVLSSCSTEQFDTTQATLEDELNTKSAQIVLNDMTAESAIAEVDYESDFYFRASDLLSQLFFKGGKWGWHYGLRYSTGQCPNVSIDSLGTDYPKTITLDYGDSTLLRNGTVLSGVIEIYISAAPNTDGFEKTVTYDNFGVDSVNISGEVSMTFTGDNETESIHTISSSLTITLPDGSTIIREGEKVREWLSGLDTPLDQSDDTIQVTGYALVTTDTTSYKVEVTTPLIKVGDCRHFVSGIIDYSEDGVVFASVNYGDGTCDDVATLTKDGETIEIDLSGQSAQMRSQNGNDQNRWKGSKGQHGNNGQGQNGNNNSNDNQGQQQNNTNGQQGNQNQGGNNNGSGSGRGGKR